MYTLSDAKRKKLRELLILAARKYSYSLMSKRFLVICDDFTYVEISFSKERFLHLTGIQCVYGQTNFYDNCKNGKIAWSDIKEKQHYNFLTLLKKCKNLSAIDMFLSADTDNTLFLSHLHTNTKEFPIAIDNVARNICIGFDDKGNANSMRTSVNHLPSDEKKKNYCYSFKGKMR